MHGLHQRSLKPWMYRANCAANCHLIRSDIILHILVFISLSAYLKPSPLISLGQLMQDVHKMGLGNKTFPPQNCLIERKNMQGMVSLNPSSCIDLLLFTGCSKYIVFILHLTQGIFHSTKTN